jgi:hypothetical protein
VRREAAAPVNFGAVVVVVVVVVVELRADVLEREVGWILGVDVGVETGQIVWMGGAEG